MTSNRICTLTLIAALAGVHAGCAGTPQDRSTGRALDDSVITAKVKTALIEAPGVNALDVNVTTFRGVVQLSGFVDSADEVRSAASAARRVEGVRSVENDLRVAATTK
jgi:osmotically-inducible protein OsmY